MEQGRFSTRLPNILSLVSQDLVQVCMVKVEAWMIHILIPQSQQVSEKWKILGAINSDKLIQATPALEPWNPAQHLACEWYSVNCWDEISNLPKTKWPAIRDHSFRICSCTNIGYLLCSGFPKELSNHKLQEASWLEVSSPAYLVQVASLKDVLFPCRARP